MWQLRWVPDFKENNRVTRLAELEWHGVIVKDKISKFSIRVSTELPVIRVF